MKRARPGKWLLRALLRPPYTDEIGRKGWFEWFSRAPSHLAHSVTLTIAGWPRTARPLRIALLSDLHTGSHAGDLDRLAAIVAEAAAHKPDLVLHGGDFVNMQPCGGGRVPPRVVAAVLAHLDAPLGCFAVLGNHDYTYGSEDVAGALERHGLVVLSDTRRTLRFEGHDIDLIGLPDADDLRPAGKNLLAALPSGRATIVLAHDPFWFAHVPPGPHLTLAGHTHGGQIRFPVLGVLRNASRAPMRWTHGYVLEADRHLYVTAGLGTSGIPLRVGVPPEYAVIYVSG